MTKKKKEKKEFIINEDGWISEVGKLREEVEPEYISSTLNASEQEALERLKKRFGNNTSDIIRRSITQYDRILRIADGEDPDNVSKENEGR